MIQQKLTKTKSTMILITKTLVIFPSASHTVSKLSSQRLLPVAYQYIYNSIERLSTSGSQAGRARATKPRPRNFRSTGDHTDPKPH